MEELPHMAVELFQAKIQQKLTDQQPMYSRYLAKNIVAAGVSKKCLIQLAYAIGVSKPLVNFY
jgi:S-adenosylmethionine synthetase